MTALLASLALFCIGVYGVLAKRDLLRILISVIIMLSGVTVLAVALAQDATMNQSFVLFAWAVEVLEIVIGLAVFLYLARKGKHDVGELRELRW